MDKESVVTAMLRPIYDKAEQVETREDRLPRVSEQSMTVRNLHVRV